MPMQDGIGFLDGAEDGRAGTPTADRGLGIRTRPNDGAGGDDSDLPVQRTGWLEFIGGSIGMTWIIVMSFVGGWCTNLVSGKTQMSTIIESGYQNGWGVVGIVVVVVLIVIHAGTRLLRRSGEERHAIDPRTIGNGRSAVHGNHSPQAGLGGTSI